MKRALLAVVLVPLLAGCSALGRSAVKPDAAPSAQGGRAADAAFRPDVRRARVGDVELAYYTRGEGPPLLMINGYMSSMSLWDPALVEELAKHHQLILFDNRGVGLSTDTEENQTTIPRMADDAAGLIRSLGFPKADVLGWSMGARIAQQVLVRHPDLVRKGILAAPNPGGRHQVKANAAVERKLNDPKVPTMDKAALAFPDDAAGRLAGQQVEARIRAAAKDGTAPDDFKVPERTALRQDRARTTLWNADDANYVALADVRVPVLVADGRDDVLDVPANSLVVANRIPFAWLAFFEGGHAFLFQDARKFAETVDVFLQ